MAPIGALGSLGNLGSVNGINSIKPPTLGNDGPAGVGKAGGKDFGSLISDALNAVNSANQKADGLAQSAATGNAQDIAQYMIASTEASVTTELAVSVRNRAVEAFQEIMRMQV
ncbi:MAG: flagellar hook-basal body complex protein FliE [Acidimicrobiia bacterium]